MILIFIGLCRDKLILGFSQVLYMHEATDSIALLRVDNCINDAIKSAVKYLEKECGCSISEVSEIIYLFT